MSIVWPCPLTVEEYASAGRRVEVPRPDCPGCSGRVVFWGGYWRHVRLQGRCRKVFVPRVWCRVCRATDALLPAFALARRLDAAEGVGGVIVEVAGGRGVRPAAARAQVPHTTARGWVRRFAARSGELAVSFSALAAELGSSALVRPAERPAWLAAAAIGEAFAAAAALPGWAALGAMAVRQRGDRREPDRRQRKLALPDRRQEAFHASQEPMTRERGGTGG